VSNSPRTGNQIRQRTGLAVAGLSLGTSLNPLNSSMIAVALVVLREDFRLDVATVTWVITAFYITSAAGQALMGRLADRFGPRKLFMLGMALVAVSCALAPFSPNFAFVCIARALMALGTATAYPSAVVMVGTLAKMADTTSTRPLGRIQMANTSDAAVGPVVGGLLWWRRCGGSGQRGDPRIPLVNGCGPAASGISFHSNMEGGGLVRTLLKQPIKLSAGFGGLSSIMPATARPSPGDDSSARLGW
jgi:MFS family permease